MGASNHTELENLKHLEQSFDVLKINIDAFFKVIMGIIVFFMQCGFAFLEAGAVRRKNTVNIIRYLPK